MELRLGLWPRVLAGEEKLVTNVLFICSRNQWRSPTAETVWRKHTGLAVRSAGTSQSAKKRVTAKDVEWANIIFVMEEKHKNRLQAGFRSLLNHKVIHVLDIPDEYHYMDAELVHILEDSVGSLLNLD